MAHSSRKRQFRWGTDALDTLSGLDLTEKTFAITGTTSGFGIETARSLALKGAHVVMLNRNRQMSENLKIEILNQKANAKIDIIICDLSSLKSVKEAAKQYLENEWPLHCLILSAGVLGPKEKMTIDNFESHFQIHHLSHFMLMRDLLPVLRKSAPSRIVVVTSSSNAHTNLKPNMSLEEKVTKLCPKDGSEFFYRLYSYSKMCNVLMAFKLHREEYAMNNISVYAAHPGKVATDVFRDFPCIIKCLFYPCIPFSKNHSQGASTSVYCAAHPEVADVSGKFWEDCWDDEKNLDAPIAKDIALQDELWKRTEKILDEWEKK